MNGLKRDLSSQILMASQISLETQRTRKMETCLHINDQWQTKRNQEREDASRSGEIPHPPRHSRDASQIKLGSEQGRQRIELQDFIQSKCNFARRWLDEWFSERSDVRIKSERINSRPSSRNGQRPSSRSLLALWDLSTIIRRSLEAPTLSLN